MLNFHFLAKSLAVIASIIISLRNLLAATIYIN